MGKRKRGPGRCVRKNTNVHNEPEELIQAPHSFVIHRGLTGGYVEELTKDFRAVMAPFTASMLKERKKNAIKDFVSIAGPLKVSHMCIFSRTEIGMYLKIARLPRGPTLTFKIHEFSLAKDVISSLKKQIVVEEAFQHSPLIVLNSFSGEGMQMKLMASMFQNMFPTINLTNVDLNTVKRCVLLNYNPGTKLIDFRHYNIKVVPVGITKGVKKVVQGKVPNLSKCNDIAELLTKSGVLSDMSEAEDDPNSHVTLNQRIISRGNVPQGKSAIRLTELGPRLVLQLLKIEDGLLDGEVLYHDLIFKSEQEKEEIQRKREIRRKLKEKRKRIQEENKKKKEVVKQELKAKSLKGMKRTETETDRLLRESAEDSKAQLQEDEDDDADYYKKEVGEEPEQDLFKKPSPSGRKRILANSSGKYKQSKRIKLDNAKTVGRAFKINKKATNQRRDKTNAQRRDFRPIGGGAFKSGVRKFNTSRKVKIKQAKH